MIKAAKKIIGLCVVASLLLSQNVAAGSWAGSAHYISADLHLYGRCNAYEITAEISDAETYMVGIMVHAYFDSGDNMYTVNQGWGHCYISVEDNGIARTVNSYYGGRVGTGMLLATAYISAK